MSNNALAPSKERITSLMNLLERKRGTIASVLPKHITPERIIKVALSAASRTPLLLQCTESSFVLAVMQAAELGLEPGSALGHAYLVPYRNGKTGKYECQMIPGYRGLIALARRSGEIVSLEAHVVYANDKFRVRYGLEPVLEHEPNLTGEPGDLVLAYAVAKLRDGGVQFEVMTRVQLEAVRRRSKAGGSGPWVSDFDEMCRKTVVRRLFKYLPVSIELAKALEVDARVEDGEGPDLSDVIDATAEEASESTGNGGRAAELKAKLRGDAERPASEPPTCEPGSEG